MLTRTSAQLVTKISIHESPSFGKEFLCEWLSFNMLMFDRV